MNRALLNKIVLLTALFLTVPITRAATLFPTHGIVVYGEGSSLYEYDIATHKRTLLQRWPQLDMVDSLAKIDDANILISTFGLGYPATIYRYGLDSHKLVLLSGNSLMHIIYMPKLHQVVGWGAPGVYSFNLSDPGHPSLLIPTKDDYDYMPLIPLDDNQIAVVIPNHDVKNNTWKDNTWVYNLMTKELPKSPLNYGASLWRSKTNQLICYNSKSWCLYDLADHSVQNLAFLNDLKNSAGPLAYNAEYDAMLYDCPSFSFKYLPYRQHNICIYSFANGKHQMLVSDARTGEMDVIFIPQGQ